MTTIKCMGIVAVVLTISALSLTAEAARLKGNSLERGAGETEDRAQSNPYVTVVNRPDGSTQVFYHDPDAGNRLVHKEIPAGQALQISYWNNVGQRIKQLVRTESYTSEAKGQSGETASTAKQSQRLSASSSESKGQGNNSSNASSSASTSIANTSSSTSLTSPPLSSASASSIPASSVLPSSASLSTSSAAPGSLDSSSGVSSLSSTSSSNAPTQSISSTSSTSEVPAAAASAAIPENKSSGTGPAELSASSLPAQVTPSSSTASYSPSTASADTASGSSSDSTSSNNASSITSATSGATSGASADTSSAGSSYIPMSAGPLAIVPTSNSAPIAITPTVPSGAQTAQPKIDAGIGASSGSSVKPAITKVPVTGENFLSATDTPLGPCVWNKFPVKVYMDPAPGATAAQLQDDVKDGFETWTKVTGNKLRFEFVSTKNNADITVSWVTSASALADPTEAGEANVSYGSHVKGKTTLKSPGYISHAKMKFMTQDINHHAWRPGELRLVALHEIGHAIGIFGHSPNAHDIMFRQKGAPELSQRDINTVNMLYASVSGE